MFVRLISETGRHSISPVFVVGAYASSDSTSTQKLGEGLGSSIKMAEYRACENALRRIYLAPSVESLLSTSAEFTSELKLPSDTLLLSDISWTPRAFVGDSEVETESGNLYAPRNLLAS